MSSASDGSNPNKKKAMTFFQTGNDAVLKANYDYAIQMYQEACKNEPENLIYRQALRIAQRKKFKDEPSKVGRLVGARTQPIRMRARSAKSKGKSAEALIICEEAFGHNPWDVGTARDAAEAAEDLGYKALAQWYMESVQVHANDADFFRHLGHVHEMNESWPKAIAAWERVKKLAPNDEDAHRKINSLAASATIKRAGLGESIAKAEQSDAERKTDAELSDMKKPQLSLEQRWMKEIQENPTMVGPYLSFADHLKGRDKLDDAQKVLARGLKAVPDDPSLQLTHAEVQIARFHREINSYEKRCQANPGDEASKAKLEQLQAMLKEFEVREFKRRVQQSPGDAQLHYELGVRLARAGHHKEAIGSFQQARSNPSLRVEALTQAGLSFEAEGALKLAQRQYEDALKAADTKDLAVMNKLHYRFGRVSEALEDTQAAIEHYSEVAANDYGYLDVAERLRRLS